MKRIVIILLMILCFQIFCNKQEEAKKEPVKEEEFDEQALTDFREKVKAEMLPRYSDERPFPDVVSKKELMEKILDVYLGSSYDRTYSIFEERPEYKDGEIGEIILVENQSSFRREEEPYYYFLYAQFKDGTIIANAVSKAMSYLNYGRLGLITFSGEPAIPSKRLSRKEAIAYIAYTYNNGDTSHFLSKAIFLNGPDSSGFPFLNWGWAVKIAKPVSLKVVDNSVKGQIFWVNPEVYDFKQALKKRIISKKDLEAYKTEVKVAVIDKDIFDPEVITSLKKYSATSEASENPKITPIEYMVE